MCGVHFVIANVKPLATPGTVKTGKTGVEFVIQSLGLDPCELRLENVEAKFFGFAVQAAEKNRYHHVRTGNAEYSRLFMSFTCKVSRYDRPRLPYNLRNVFGNCTGYRALRTCPACIQQKDKTNYNFAPHVAVGPS
jgi:hypothetical protein